MRPLRPRALDGRTGQAVHRRERGRRPAAVGDRDPAYEAELGVRRRDDLAVHDQPEADAGADREQGQAIVLASRAEPGLLQGERHQVVADGCRRMQPLLDELGQGHLVPSQERGVGDRAPRGGGAAQAHPGAGRGGGVRPGAGQLGRGVGQCRDGVGGGVAGQGAARRGQDVQMQIGEYRGQGLTGQVHPDHGLRLGAHLQRGLGTPHPGRTLSAGDEESAVHEWSGQTRDRAGRDADDPHDLGTGQAAVAQQGQDDRPLGVAEPRPRTGLAGTARV